MKKNTFLQLLSTMKLKLFPYLLGLIGTAGVNAYLNLLLAFVIKDTLNGAIKGEFQLIINTLILSAVSLLGVMLVSPFFTYLQNSSVQKTIFHLRSKLFKHLEGLPISFYDEVHSGDTLSRISNDVQTLEKAFSTNIYNICYAIIVGVFAIVSILLLEWRSGLLIILFAFVSVLINFIFIRPIRKQTDFIQKEQGKLTELLSDFLAGMKEARMFHLGEILSSKFEKKNQALCGANAKFIFLKAMVNNLNSIYQYLNLAALILIFAFSVSLGVNIGIIFAILIFRSYVSYFFTNIGNFITQIQPALSGTKRIFEILEEPSEAEFVTLTGSPSSSYLGCQNVSFAYDKKHLIFEKLNLDFKKEQVTALVGPSGSGKTTLFKILLGLYVPQSGSITLTGKSISEYKLKELRDHMAYVSQDSYLFEGSLEENIALGNPLATPEDILLAAKNAFAYDFIMEMPEGFKTQIGERGVRLSGGQKQRIAIARALLKNAPILLLDEATSALDSQSEQEVNKALKKLMENRTTLVIAHRLSTIEKADKIFVIDKGHVVQEGNHDGLLNQKGLYQKLYQLQFTKIQVKP